MEINTQGAAGVSLPVQMVGAIKTFGEVGEPYEVLGVSRPAADGDWLMKIRMVKTGEETEYSYRHILDDPKAI